MKYPAIYHYVFPAEATAKAAMPFALDGDGNWVRQRGPWAVMPGCRIVERKVAPGQPDLYWRDPPPEGVPYTDVLAAGYHVTMRVQPGGGFSPPDAMAPWQVNPAYPQRV